MTVLMIFPLNTPSSRMQSARQTIGASWLSGILSMTVFE
jgi:hypothetical protein